MILCRTGIHDTHKLTPLMLHNFVNLMIYRFMCLLPTMYFSLGMTSNCICYCGTPHVCVVTEEVLDRIMKNFHYEYLKAGEKIQYSHKV